LEGYEFQDNGICHKKRGYYKKIRSRIPGMENASGDRTERITTYFLGTETKYKIDGDVLSIFDLTDSAWQEAIILRLSNDTLSLQLSDNTTTNFVRTRYQFDTTQLFDEVVVSTSGCFGTCPITSTLISQSGEVVYYGEQHTIHNGLYRFTLTKEEYNKVRSDFAKAKFNELEKTYEADWTDDEEITITFLKHGKIVKSITDYGKVGPNELFWAYTPVRSMYQLKVLDSITTSPSVLGQPREFMSSIQSALDLSKSETFYLWNLLRQSTEVNVPFVKKYSIGFDEGYEIRKLETDGRYFAFETSGGKRITFDIGFNYFEINGLNKK
jgi:hypothetical protein